uniref:Type-4 ice-structuring protein LS-12-like n=1 Tax=Cynoglossus semilaevis TaxID=244447 RepID=A0A3P8WAS5_CYNSE
MKFTLIAAVVLLALAQGSFAQDANLDIVKYFEDFRTKLTQDMATLVGNPELATQTENFLQEKKTQLEPLAAKIQEQVKTVAANAQAQFQPMMESLQTQMEDFFQRLTEQRKKVQ